MVVRRMQHHEKTIETRERLCRALDNEDYSDPALFDPELDGDDPTISFEEVKSSIYDLEYALADLRFVRDCIQNCIRDDEELQRLNAIYRPPCYHDDLYWKRNLGRRRLEFR